MAIDAKEIDRIAQAITNVFKRHGWRQWQNCTTCHMFDKSREFCMIAKPAQRPPASVIVTGCDKHSDIDDIPF